MHDWSWIVLAMYCLAHMACIRSCQIAGDVCLVCQGLQLRHANAQMGHVCKMNVRGMKRMASHDHVQEVFVLHGPHLVCS